MILVAIFAEKLQMNMKSGEEMRYDLVDQRPQLGDNSCVFCLVRNGEGRECAASICKPFFPLAKLFFLRLFPWDPARLNPSSYPIFSPHKTRK